MKNEIINYRGCIHPLVPDVLNVCHEQLTEARLRNGVIFGKDQGIELPVNALISEIIKLQEAYDSRLALAIIDRRLPAESVPLLRQTAKVLENNKAVVVNKFASGWLENGCGDQATQLTAHRLLHLLSLSDTPHLLDKYSLEVSPTQGIFIVPSETDGILKETLALLPFAKNVVGFQVRQNGSDRIVTLFVNADGKNLTRTEIKVDGKDKAAMAKNKKTKRILIAVEGDIAGHAVRALETARGLRRLDYEPTIVGSGYYARPFVEEGFNCLPPFNTEQTAERDRIITQARGEGKGLFFWDFDTVKKRVEGFKTSLRGYVQSGVDLFLCDMNPIVDIAVSHLQKETGRTFPKLTETHNILLSATRSLRALKVGGISMGEYLYKVNGSRVLKLMDPKGFRFAATHFIFNEIADVVMGLPLSVYERLHGGSGSRIKFTDYMYGRDGTLQFCFKPDSRNTKSYPVGLQADRGKTDGSDRDHWEAEIPADKAFVLNSQGSTYHKKAWDTVVDGLAETPTLFSVHVTGIKEDQPSPLGGSEVTGYKVGYVAGYRMAQRADVVINHGGFGTISQWLMATADRICEERQILDRIVQAGSPDEVPAFLMSCRGISRSLSLCNTFEQENNSRSLNEVGGDHVCTVTTADALLQTTDPKAEIREKVEMLLTDPVDNQEREFWLDLVKYEATMNAPIHAALILERIMMTGK